MRTVVFGSFALVVLTFCFLYFKPVPGAQVGILPNLAAALLVVVFGFLFVTVSSRIVGLIGSSANPMSGMAIATLMATCAVFLVEGWTAPAYGALAITIGGIVAIAAANAGDTSQDLKTGYLVGSTPRLQQIALMIGVVVSTVSIGVTLNLMNTGLQKFRSASQPWNINASHPGVAVQNRRQAPPRADSRPRRRQILHHPPQIRVHHPQRHRLARIGRRQIPLLARHRPNRSPVDSGHRQEQAAAPQARLMATVINGILSRKLPWGLVLLGVFLVIAVELLGVRSLSFAVGAYLSIGTTLAIFVGGMVRWFVDAAVKKAGGESTESEISPGSLFASGLIAAGGIVGLIGVALKGYETTFKDSRDLLNFPHTFIDNNYVSVSLRRAGLFPLLLRPQAAEEVARSTEIGNRRCSFSHWE